MCKPPVAASADIPLLAKGVVISDGSTRYVLCSLDYCELRLGAHDLFRRTIANALGVNELQIEVHSIHPHDAPLYDTHAELLVEMAPSPPHTTDLAFIAIASERVASAVERMDPVQEGVLVRGNDVIRRYYYRIARGYRGAGGGASMIPR